MLPRRYLPSMPALLALEALERLGSASAAAAELALTQGAVSRQIKALEAQLGVVLFLRDRQRLIATPAARDYAGTVRKTLSNLGSAALTLCANPAGGSLSLAILPAFGLHWLAPRLPGFVQAHPGVTVNLSTRLRPFDLREGPQDAAIHYGRPETLAQDWPGVSCLHIMDEEVLAVAAPGRLAAPLPAAAAVLDHPLLMIEGRAGDWGRWLAQHGHPGARPPGMLFDQFATLAQAAVHGLGLALLPTFLIGRELAEGRLVPVFGPPVPARGAYFLVWPADRPERAPLAAFRGWLAGQVAPAAVAQTAAPAAARTGDDRG